ncbi:oligosaccharide flippase family protein [Methanobacterium aggregans]|uniref:oligosaccharide flippase family protein n=1 Tax=Methanobacterium aggregans TaxID=1615586 RepID=UPI001AE400D5|nr:oligosaccharide flippase family protein [Methanobacterium aggregans]MBP2047061.1 O-antigen/teichoic acid export membrane protein [Methanobacterium aggregans]
MSKLKIPFKSLIRNAKGDDRESLKGKLIYGIFWNLISALASQGFPMIAAIIAARLLGKFGYGQLGMINSTVILFSTFAGLGLGITATKYIAQLHQTDPERTGRIMGLTNLFGLASGVVMCIILFVMAPWLAANTLAAPDLAPALRIASILLIFNTMVGIQSGSIAGFGAFKDLARIAIFQGVISASLTVTGVYFFGLTGAVTAMVINSIINFILYKLTINNLVKRFKISISYIKSWREKDVIWKLSLPSMLSSVMVGPVIWIANVIIINTPGGYGQLGLFNAADQWRTALAFLPSVIGGVLLPMVSANINKENKALETVNVLTSWVLVIIIALPLISFPEIIAFFYGQGYFSTVFLQSLAIMMFISCITSYKEGIARKLIAKNLMWWGFLSNLIWGILFIVAIMFFKNLGSLGLAVSYLISYAINTIIFVPFYLSRKVVPRDLILSKEVLLVWIVLIVQTIITLIGVSLWIRFIFLMISIVILIFSFYRIWSK